MEHLIVFVFLHGMCYFVNYGVSHPIDYEAKKKRLCKLAGIEGRECTNSEAILLKTALEAQQEAENLRDKLQSERDSFNSVAYCNIYREQTDNFELLFSQFAFQKLFPSFTLTFKKLVSIFNRERTNASRTLIPSSKKLNFNLMSRQEKWRVIQAWFFSKLVVNAETKTKLVNTDNESSLIEASNSDFDVLEKSVSYAPIARLRKHWLATFCEIQDSVDIDFINKNIKSTSKGVHDAYQWCSRHIRRFRKLDVSADKFPQMRLDILAKSTEEADDLVIHQCLDLMVNIGKQLVPEPNF